MVTGKTKVYGLIGHPVEHSFSPQLHAMLAKMMHVDMVYTTFNVKEKALEQGIEGIRALNIAGVNVTVPYKMAVMPYLDQIDDVAKQIGAVNTIVSKENQLIGYNTDYLGLQMALDQAGILIKNQEIVIIGAGGAARAVAIMCGKIGVKQITVINRTKEKAEKLVMLIRKYFQVQTKVVPLEDIGLLSNLGIVFQTTSVGMWPNTEASPISKKIDYGKMQGAVDLIFNPVETAFLKEARKAKVATMNGLGMLYYQGVIAFELWHGKKPEADILEKNFREFIQSRNQGD